MAILPGRGPSLAAVRVAERLGSPLLALTALVLTVLLRAPQLRLLRAAFRGARARDEKAAGAIMEEIGRST